LDQQKDLHVSQMDEPLRIWPAWRWWTVPYGEPYKDLLRQTFRLQSSDRRQL